ncbi:MAG: serine/threonine protein kinase [Lentisphaerae bacterium]|nr:serine/threonine protein kinase [Lentisphaerota bacterium]
MSNFDIPGFEILEKIGAGGMATVWKARQISLDRIVAIKILYSKFASDPADVQRFQKEAQAAARLKHPGIVQVYDASALGGMYYFIMEYVAGYTVGEWIKRKGALSIKDALLVAECVADALAYAWSEAGVIHCDIKPDNMLVDADGSVKVSDLGLARTLSHMLAEGASGEDIMGTPSYISPEQALGTEPLDFRSDIYSLGASLYHMVTGQVPFGQESPDAVMDLQVNATLPDPIDVNPEVPPQVCWLIEKMMCKDPAGRSSSWTEVQQDLARVKKGLRPLGEALPEGMSTVERSPARTKSMRTAADLLATRRAGPVTQVVRLVAVLLVAAGGLWLFLAWNHGKLDGLLAQLNGVPSPSAGTSAPGQAAMDDRWAEDYQNALAWFAAHPGRYDDAMAMLSRLADAASGTPYSGMARTRVDALRREKQQRVDGVLQQLSRAAAPLAAASKFAAAADLYTGYRGEFAQETLGERQRRAAALKAQAEAARALPPAPQRPLDDVLDTVAAQVLDGRYSDAVVTLGGAIADPGHAAQASELAGLKEQVEGAMQAEARILDSFARQKGKQVKVQLRTGLRELNVRDVRDGKIVADVYGESDLAPTHGTIEFDVKYLQYTERLRRMGSSDFPGSALYMGLMAAEAGSTASARRYFGQTSPLIADRLMAGKPSKTTP